MSVFVLQVSVAIPFAVIRGVADIQVRVNSIGFRVL